MTGVYENLFRPKLNSTFTRQMLGMERLRREYPDAYADVAYRKMSNAQLAKLLFWVIVAWEAVAALMLLVATLTLIWAFFRVVDPQMSRSLGMIGALLFTSTCAGY